MGNDFFKKKQNPRSEGKDYRPREMKRSSGLKPGQAGGCEPPGLLGGSCRQPSSTPGSHKKEKSTSMPGSFLWESVRSQSLGASNIKPVDHSGRMTLCGQHIAQ